MRRRLRLSLAFGSQLKFYFSRRLIWGRGRLARPFLNLAALSLALVVFLSGGVFQERLVVTETAAAEFISGESSIVPERIVARLERAEGPRQEAFEYTVAEGDTLSTIGQSFGVTVESIRYANNLTSLHYLKIGQALIIPPVSGAIHEVKSGDSLGSLAKEYEVAEQAIADFNYLDEPFALAVGQKLIIPDAKIPPLTPPLPVTPPTYGPAAYVTLPRAVTGVTGTGRFMWPTRYQIITQYFSWYHPAIDIGKDSPIFASDSGTVVRAGWWTNGYGFAIQIDHGNGYVTTYAHLSRIDAAVGRVVGQGEVIGQMGSTGRSTGPHLHFTIQYNGGFLNPLSYL